MRYFHGLWVVFLLGHCQAVLGDESPINDTCKTVLVTGASSGIGKQIAITLAEKGFCVYAGARKEKDIRDLNNIPNVEGIRLDVTVQSDIDQVAEMLRGREKGLYGLVNNAGVFLFDPLIEISEEDMQFVMDVNLFGPYRVTKALAPLVIEQKGRITTIGSIAGLSSGRLLGPYAMSKHAIEAFTESLALELEKFDVQVSVIEPGNFRSNIMKNMGRRVARLEKEESKSRFKTEIAGFAGFVNEDRSHHQAPTPVAEAVLHFLTHDTPKRRYMVAPNAREAHFTIENALRKAVELNRGQAFELSHQELVETLGAILKSDE